MFGKLLKKGDRYTPSCYVTCPNTANQNIAVALRRLNAKLGKDIEITGINDRDNRKCYFTGAEMMLFSIDRLDLSSLAAYEYLFKLTVKGGGGSGASDVLLQYLRRMFNDSPIIIPIEIITENPSIRAQLISALSIYVNLKLRGKDPIWLFSNSELMKGGRKSYSSANEEIANLIWCLAHAHNDESSDFDLSAVSQGAFTGGYCEINLQRTAVETERNVVMTARRLLGKPWIDSRDILWNGDKLELSTRESVVVCLVPNGINLRSLGIDLEELENNAIYADYPYPTKIKDSRRIPIHISSYPGKTIKIIAMTKISENTLERALKLHEAFLKRVHDAAATKKELNDIEKVYLDMYREEYRKNPKGGEYPWETIFEL